MQPHEAAADFVATHFPDARAAFVGGSVITPHRTETSDLDVVVVLDGPPAPYRETFRHQGWVVEAFVHDDASLSFFYAQDRDRRVCSLLRMVGDSDVVVDGDGSAARLQTDARALLAAGPGPFRDTERDAIRYLLSDLLDDLQGCRTVAELPWIAALLLVQTAQLALAAAGRWGGQGKALHRALAAQDPSLAGRLVEGHRAVVADGRVEQLQAVVLEVLDGVGGPLVEGHRVAGPGSAADVLLVTCSWLPGGEDGGHLIVEELAERGLVGRWVAWDDPSVDWSSARAVAVRSTWDYEQRREEFLAWARTVGPALLNGADALAWNTDKAYLLELVAAGLPVVPTLLATTRDEARRAAARFAPAVVKPTVAASGRGLVVMDGDGDPAGTGPWLVQPVVESVHTEGEVSVFVLGGRPVAQVRKVAGGDDVRVHEAYGGRSVPVPLDDEHAALAARTVVVAEELLGADLSYARVDLMRLADGTLAVGELEVTEPGLYLDLVPGLAADFAAMVAERLS
ncbi:MAG: hypothetical protein ABIQ59_03270 [Nocardioidaceae bacterium]